MGSSQRRNEGVEVGFWVEEEYTGTERENMVQPGQL